MKLNDAKSVTSLLQQAADVNPDDPSIYYWLAAAVEPIGRNDESRVALRRVPELYTSALGPEKRALRDADVVGAR